MALGALGGFLLQRFADVDGATMVGLLLGMLAANFVPLPSCGEPPEG